MCEGPSGYFYKMLSYLEETIRAGVREGRFSAAQARADLEVALWVLPTPADNVDEYEYYYRAADWMSDSETGGGGSRERHLVLPVRLRPDLLLPAGGGPWSTPGRVWSWTRATCGATSSTPSCSATLGNSREALAAVDRGLELEPGGL